MISKICEATHFSSDVSLDMLIYSESDGSIRTHTPDENAQVLVSGDSFKKDVKFYPPDTLVFTTTGATGLTIWNREKQRILYKYKEETLYSHSYSKDMILASFDDYNIKFYDLKCRFLANSKPLPNIRQIGWIEEYIYCFDGEKIVVFDYRSMEEPVFVFGCNGDFAVCDGTCYFIKKEANRFYLTQTEPSSDAYIKKETQYSRILPLKGHNAIAGIVKDGLKIETGESIKSIKLKNYSIESLHFTKDHRYLFANGGLFEINESLESFSNAVEI